VLRKRSAGARWHKWLGNTPALKLLNRFQGRGKRRRRRRRRRRREEQKVYTIKLRMHGLQDILLMLVRSGSKSTCHPKQKVRTFGRLC